MKLGVRILLGAIFNAKKTGKGRSGRGKIYVELMKMIADSGKNISLSFGGNIDRFLLRLLRGETDYPYILFGFDKFEKSIGNFSLYMNYIFKMTKFCDMVLDENKIKQLIYTLLEILHQDDTVSEILYGSEFIPKEKLFGSYAHPRKICVEALLLGLLYHVHKNPVESENIGLLNIPDRLKFHVVRYSDEKSLDPEMPIKLVKNIHENAKRQKSAEMKYSLELRSGDEILTDIPDSGNVFLFGVGGAGKTTLLMNQINSDNSVNFYFSLYKYKQEIHENLQSESCWILLQILLKYHYQYEYQTYEMLIANESENAVLQQFAELKSLLKIMPIGRKAKYTLLLDGINELPSESQEQLVDELNYIVREWKNVRIMITGRTVPMYTVFDDFQQLEICGVSDIERDGTLSEFADISINTRLLELLKTPLFLNMYLESDGSKLNTRGEILDSYIIGRNFQRNSVIQFILQYVLPFAASKMISNYDYFAFQNNNGFCYEIARGELFKAIDQAYETYLFDEYVYQSYIAPKGFRKKSLLESREKIDFIELILENIGLMKISENDFGKLHFTHQYFRDYFAAKHILNLLEIMITSYKNSSVDEQKEIFRKFELDKNWFFDELEIYKLFGEICGDYKNIPNGNDSMWWYHRTILDIVLDMYRKFDAEIDDMHITENIIKTMSISRHNLICEVNFDRVPLPFNIPCNIKFSQDGKYPCSFKHCIVDRLGICDDSEKVTAPNWEKYSVFSPDKKQLLIILDNNYVLLWDNISEKILWDDDISRYTDGYIEFDYAEFSQDGEEIIFLANDGRCRLYTLIVEAVSGIFIGYSREFSHDFNYTGYQPLDEQLKLKIFSQLPHFRNCDFTGAEFFDDEGEKLLRVMGAVIDEIDS